MGEREQKNFMCAAVEQFMQRVRLSRRFSAEEMYESLEGGFQQEGYRQSADSTEQLLIISLNAIGDNVIYSAFLRELRRNYPYSHITMVVTPLVYPLLETCPYINRLLKLSYTYTEPFSDYFFRFGEFAVRELLPHHYDMSICTQWSDDKKPINLLAYLSGARERMGISDKSFLAYLGYNNDIQGIDQWESLLTNSIITPIECLHEADRALHIVEALGNEVKEKKLELWLTAADLHRAGVLTADMQAYIVLGVGAGAPNRKYPLVQWLQAMTQIYEKYRMPFIICGGRSEAADGAYIQQRMPQGSVLNLAGKTTLRETAALIKGAYCYLGNVTGAMHMAAALDTPLVTLYREAKNRAVAPAGLYSESTRFAPWQAKAVVLQPEIAKDDCLHTVVYGGCKENYAHCIAQITPQEIVAAFNYMAENLC